eukprot:4109297-Amphidinium_carterae.2
MLGVKGGMAWGCVKCHGTVSAKMLLQFLVARKTCNSRHEKQYEENTRILNDENWYDIVPDVIACAHAGFIIN